MNKTETDLLSDDAVKQYFRDGFLVVKNLYSENEMQTWKNKLMAILKEEGSINNTSGVRVFFMHDIHSYFKDKMGDPKVVSILRQIIGPQIEFLSVKAVFKNNKTKFNSPWHQDWYYWKGANKTSVWIALDDAIPENGCLKMIPCSHKKLFPWNTIKSSNLFSHRTEEDEIKDLPFQTLALKRGGAVFFHDRTLHSSYPNSSGADRYSFISTYRDASIKDESSVWDSAMVVSGDSVNG